MEFIKAFFHLIRVCIFPRNLEELAIAFTIYSIPLGIILLSYMNK